MPDHPEPPDRPVPAPPREAVQRWRLVVARTALDPSTGQREQLQAWEEALAGCGLPVAGFDASPQRARYALAAPLGAAMPGEAELVDVWLTERVPAWRVRETFTGSVPAGYRLVEAHDVWLGAPALPGQVVASVYRATFGHDACSEDGLSAAAAGLLGEQSLPRERRKGQGTVSYDLRPFIADLAVDGGGADEEGSGVRLRMTLRHDPERGIGRPDEVLAALAERVGSPLEPRSIVREALVLAPPPKPEAGPRPGSRAPGRSGMRQPSAATRRPRK